MKRTILNLVFVFSGVTFLSGIAFAQTLRVNRVKGNKAVIEIIDGSVSPGQVLTTEASRMPSSLSTGGPRNQFIGIKGGAGLSKVRGSSDSMTSFSVDTLYGWNKRTIEYGWIFGLGVTSGGGSSSTTIGVGGKFDYNFSENIPSAQSLFSAGVEAKYAMIGSSGQSNSSLNIFPMLSWRWFLFGNSTSLRLDAGFNYVMNMGGGSSAASDSELNPNVVFGLYNYF